MNNTILVYGSYGYTGRLIVAECNRKNLTVLLAGRDEAKLRAQSEASGYPYEVVDIADTPALHALLRRARVVIHCGGPFRFTATAMVTACLETGTHYTDITGEYEVFEQLAGMDALAREKNIMVMPGTGFDVVPSDCLAFFLKQQLPDATHLQLAFTSSGGFSRGTSRTMIEGLGQGSTVRENGKLTSIPTASRVLTVDFGSFTSQTVCIPWGDIATAFRSTGIPNIEVYAGVHEKTIRQLKFSNYINWLLRLRAVKNFLRKQVDKKPAGPSEEKLSKARSYLWGRVRNAAGRQVEARLETYSGYALTAMTSVLIAQEILAGNFSPGYKTPAMQYGGELMELSLFKVQNSKFKGE
jgi:short subunit dehydrogenase-like uncharacterized protein